jgi:tetratricopeptide (TPR) repeat protein
LIIATDTGKVLFYARRYSQAIEWLRKVLAEDQTFEEAHIYMAETLLAMGRFQEALADLDRFPEWAHKSWYLDRRAFALGKLGRLDEARSAIVELERMAARDGKWTYAGLGSELLY